MEHIVHFLQTSGLLHGNIPLLTAEHEFYDLGFKACVTDHIVYTYEPAHAIIASIWLSHPKRNQPKIGGISVHNLHMNAYKNHQYTLPDLLLGFISPDGKWHWPLAECDGVACNLRNYYYDVKMPAKAWPVFFTCSDYEYSALGSNHVDLTPWIARGVCRMFWNLAYKEFIAKTWAPERLAWCLDHEEAREWEL